MRGPFRVSFWTFERFGAVQQQFGGSQAKDSCNNRRITVGIISYCIMRLFGYIPTVSWQGETFSLTGTRLEYGVKSVNGTI